MKRLEIDRVRLRGLLSQKQRQVAVAIGINENTLYRKLKGETRFYLDELNKLAIFLNIDTTDFLVEVEVETDDDELSS